MRLLLPLLALAACAPTSTGFQKPRDEDTGDTAEDTDTDTDPVDTADTDGDLDDDGFTPEEGDCDDADIRVSPAREEEGGDGKDNDCDGRTDEEWSGFSVGWIDDDAAGHIVLVDTIGREADVVDLSEGCYPVALDHYGDGWVVQTGSAFTVETVAADGTCTTLADFTDAEVYEYGAYGVAVAPDGTVLTSTADSLVGIAADGTVTVLQEWVVDFEDIALHELAPTSLAVDVETGEVGLFDVYGGFATWSADAGLELHLKGDYNEPALVTTAGAKLDGGGWYTQGIDTVTGAYGIYSFDLGSKSWVLEEEWDAESDWSPQALAIDSDSGDWYVTANVGGIFPTVYRVEDRTGYAADFYRRTEDYAGNFYGIATNYTYGE